MLALIAGRGGLPGAVAGSLSEPVLICALEGSLPDSVSPEIVFPIEHLGGFLKVLKSHGVTRLCLCGAVDRPRFSPRRLDFATLVLLPRILRALRRGDDGALRIAISIFEDAGLEVLAAHEAAPELLLPAGIPTKASPGDRAWRAARNGDRVSEQQAAQDLGQACIVSDLDVLARESDAGTDAMLDALDNGARTSGAIFYKAPKPGQDRRADLPVIGPETATRAAALGLSGLVIEAGGVMVLDAPRVIDILNTAGLFLWVRERPD